MANPKFLNQVGSQSLSPPVIIEGGIRYIAEDPKAPPPLIVQNGEIVPIGRANYFAGAYAEDEPAPPEPPHELDVIQKLSEQFRALSQNDKGSIPHECEYTDLADCVLNCRPILILFAGGILAAFGWVGVHTQIQKRGQEIRIREMQRAIDAQARRDQERMHELLLDLDKTTKAVDQKIAEARGKK